MATGRLASASIAAGTEMQLYTNTTGSPQIINLLASSQVSGASPKLSVKISTENITTISSSTGLLTNQTLAVAYPSSLDIEGEGETGGVYNQGAGFANDVTKSGNRLYLSPTLKNTTHIMGQAWSPGYHVLSQQNSDVIDHPWSKVAFDGQPQCVGGSGGGKYRYSNAGQYGTRYQLHMPDPYYLENPNAYNQKKARWIVDNTGALNWHVEDISKMPTSILRKYYSGWEDWGSPQALSDGHSRTIPDSGEAWGTVTAKSNAGPGDRGWIYDEWTGLHLAIRNNGYHQCRWWNENDITANAGTEGNYDSGQLTSNSGIWRWSNNAWQGSDPFNYDTDGRGSVYGTFMDMDHGLICAHAGSYYSKFGLKWMGTWFDEGTMDNKDTRAGGNLISMATFTENSYYHTIDYQGSGRYQKLQWVKYNPNTDKHYICLWDTSGSYSADPIPTMGTSYPSEAGIFEVDVALISGYSSSRGNTESEAFSTAVDDGVLTKVASVPDAVSGFMSRPVRLKASLWTSHCQDGKQYFSSDLVNWAEKSSTYIPDAYIMVNDNSSDVSYYVAAGSTSIVYSSTISVSAYDQVALAGLIAKGATTPYEQKGIILSDGDFIYVENEDSTNAITIHAMGVDI